MDTASSPIQLALVWYHPPYIPRAEMIEECKGYSQYFAMLLNSVAEFGKNLVFCDILFIAKCCHIVKQTAIFCEPRLTTLNFAINMKIEYSLEYRM